MSCDAANALGWQVGIASAVFAVVLLLLRVLLCPALGPTRLKSGDTHARARSALHYAAWLMPCAWLAGGWWLRGAYILCYGRGLAFSVSAVLGVLLAVTITAAANQIGRRSVR
jgi:hypothetical protein